MVQSIAILGSTGSIGTQTIQVAKDLNINVKALSANSSIELLEKQIIELKPDFVCVVQEEKAKELKQKIKHLSTKVLAGSEGLNEIITSCNVDLIVNSVVGNIGLSPTIEAIKLKKHIALANKEVLVSAGEYVMNLAKQNNVNIYPIDSEHSAIFQCLQGSNKQEVEKIILTASGGPFRTFKSLQNISLEQALNHPNWKMGKKITIDSATLMNKGLEVIEAKWLFDLDLSQIDVIVHPESIIHSMVQYKDGSVIAQLGTPDMKLPIQYAITYPNRIQNNYKRLDLTQISTLNFEKPNYNLFPCLKLAFHSIKVGGTLPAVLNASNEIAVTRFLNGEIQFEQIPYLVEKAMESHSVIKNYTIDDIFEIDAKTRIFTTNFKI